MKKQYLSLKEAVPVQYAGHKSYDLLTEQNGCVNGCKAGISIYDGAEFGEPGIHTDQEGFLVTEGTGWARLGDQEIRLEADVSFIVPAGVPHSIKRDPEAKYVKVFWFHSPV